MLKYREFRGIYVIMAILTYGGNVKLVSLFTGIGGFERGLDFAHIDYEPVFASEIDIPAQKTYLANYKPVNLVGDITKIDEKDVPAHDFLVGGFPCQAFSIAGKRKGFDDARGTLFFDVLRILKLHKPDYFLLENVKNLVNHDGSNTIRVILDCLAELEEYAIDFSIVNAKEAGAPQNRERTYIVGIKNGKKAPFETDKRSAKIDGLKKELNEKNYPSFNFFNSLTFNNEQLYIKDIISKNVSDNFYLKSKDVENFLAENTFREDKNPQCKIVKLFDLPKEVHNDLERQRRVYSIYGISPTVLARSDTTKIYVTHNGKKAIRKFTPAENFRIQGYDEEFIKNILDKSGNSNTQLYKQAGNAVSPLAIAGITKHIFEKNKEGRSVWL